MYFGEGLPIQNKEENHSHFHSKKKKKKKKKMLKIVVSLIIFYVLMKLYKKGKLPYFLQYHLCL